jgi:hypothetical protein
MSRKHAFSNILQAVILQLLPIPLQGVEVQKRNLPAIPSQLHPALLYLMAPSLDPECSQLEKGIFLPSALKEFLQWPGLGYCVMHCLCCLSFMWLQRVSTLFFHSLWPCESQGEALSSWQGQVHPCRKGVGMSLALAQERSPMNSLKRTEDTAKKRHPGSHLGAAESWWQVSSAHRIWGPSSELCAKQQDPYQHPTRSVQGWGWFLTDWSLIF